MNRLLAIIIFLTIGGTVLLEAHNEDCRGQISGKVLDSEEKPIEGVSVYIMDDSSDKNVLACALSDEQGIFTISAPCGETTVCFSCVGYDEKKLDVDVLDASSIDLGACRLEQNVTELQTIVVKGTPMRVKYLPDGYSINVRDLAASSNNALDLLSRLPQINVKGNEIKVIGKENILLRVNNVVQRVSAEELPNVLRGYSADLIKSVDVITSPSVKYDSDGSTAMIVLHTTSSFNRYLGGSIGMEIMKGARYNGRYGVYGSLIFNNDKLFIDVTPSFNHNYSYMKERVKYSYDNGTDYTNNSPSKGHSNYTGGYLTLQYQYNSKGYLGVNTNIGTRKTSNSFMSEEIDLSDRIYNWNHIGINRPRINATVYAEHSFSNSFTGWLEATYYRYREDSDQEFKGMTDYDTPPFMSYLTNQKLNNSGFTVSNDYSLAVLENRLSLDFGVKGYFAWMTNSRTNSLNNTGMSGEEVQSDRLSLDEMKLNPYFSLTYRPAAQFYFRIGTQVSHNRRTLKSIEMDTHNITYTNFLPNLTVAWLPDAISSLSLNVTSGCVDPKFDAINPFEWRTSQFTYIKGNTDLKSESRYNYRLTYTYKGFLSMSAYTNQKRNQISPVAEITNGNVYYVTKNAQNTVDFGIRPSYYFNRLNWMEASAEVYWAYSVSKGKISGIPQKTTSNLWGGNLYASFIFNHERTLTGYVTLDYTGRQKTSLSIVDPIFDCGLGISWFLLKRQLNISLSALNLFSSPYKGYSLREGYTINFNNRFNFPTLYFSVSYKFNNVKDSSPRRKNVVRDVEQRM